MFFEEAEIWADSKGYRYIETSSLNAKDSNGVLALYHAISNVLKLYEDVSTSKEKFA